jgi:hypothetical protein
MLAGTRAILILPALADSEFISQASQGNRASSMGVQVMNKSMKSSDSPAARLASAILS